MQSLKLQVWSAPSESELAHLYALTNLKSATLVVHKEHCVEDALVLALARCGTLRSFAMLPSDLPRISAHALGEHRTCIRRAPRV